MYRNRFVRRYGTLKLYFLWILVYQTHCGLYFTCIGRSCVKLDNAIVIKQAAKCGKIKCNAPVDYTDKWYKRNACIFIKVNLYTRRLRMTHISRFLGTYLQ